MNRWSSFTPDVRGGVLKVLLERENRMLAVLEAIEAGTMHRGDLSSVQRDQLSGSGDRAVAQKAREIFKSDSVAAELQARLDLYQQGLTGPKDLAQGEKTFTQACLVCHQLNGKGNQVGPFLGSIVTQPDELILLNILDPDSKIDPEYKLYFVTADGGQVFAGVLSAESPTSITIRTATGEERVVLRENIVSMTASEVSLMPANFHTSINPQNMASLIEFLRKSFTADDTEPDN